jgi:DNA polymerase III subunit gamma/tau
VETTEVLDLPTVQAAWDAYVLGIERDSQRYQLQSAQLAVEELTITTTVGSNLTEAAIRSESDLTEVLRRELKAPGLMLKIIVDPSLRKEEPLEKPKTLTPRDKYVAMVAQNPAVKELVSKFGLKPEE